MRRVAVYVDGLNLYYGLREAGFQRYYWLDLWRLAATLLRRDQTLIAVRYFTAKFAPDPAIPTVMLVKMPICKRWTRCLTCPYGMDTTCRRPGIALGVERRFRHTRKK